MLRIIQSSSVAQAKSYYTSGLAREDYYAEGQECVGRWGGQGAARLGLEGRVDAPAFSALCDNQHPVTGERLTARTKADRTVGYDFNFHAPKSVSVVYELTRDERVAEAFRESVDETMRQIEGEVRTRVRQGGANAERTTANLTWATFDHHTARPVDGLPDPHLHEHVFVFNATYDTTERKWKAAQFRELKRDAPYFEACFHARFAERLKDLGYGIERTEQGWDVSGVPRSVIEKFSRRTHLIEAEAKRRGLTEDRLKDGLGAQTRESKLTDLTQSELRKEWFNRMSASERAAVTTAHRPTKPSRTPPVTAEQAREFAGQHHFERASVVDERTFLRTALRYGVGSVSVEAAHEEVQSSTLLRKSRDERTFVTSREVLHEEQVLLAYARDGRGTCKPLTTKYQKLQRTFLSAEQQTAVKHIWSSTDRVTAIRGAAGVGKTTLMMETVEGIEAHGKRVYTFAPSAQASRGVLRQEGFAKAETVAKLLQDEKIQRAVRGQVIWIDEAGLLGTRTLHDVFQLAEKTDARVVLSGDSRQHVGVERGDSLRLLEEYAGIVPAEVTQIRRQSGEYKRAIEALSRGQAAEGFDRLDQLGFVSELPDDQRYQKLAADYVDAVKRNKNVLVVAPTHAEGEHVTMVIRDRLKVEGRLDVEEKSLGRLKNRNWTEAERTDVARYHAGDVVQFLQNAKGIRRGERLTVNAVEEGVVWLNHGEGRVPLPVNSAKSYQVFAVEDLGLAPGDRIRITQNGTTRDGKHRLNNGAHYEIAGFTSRGDVKLANGWTVDRDFGHWAYGYATTSHASQGKTVDQVFVAQSSTSLPASSLEQFYVSCSRAKEKVVIYTDDKAALKAAIQESTQRLSATELLAEPPPAATPPWRERAWEQFERIRQYGHQLQTTARESWQRWRESATDRTPPTPKRELAYE